MLWRCLACWMVVGSCGWAQVADLSLKSSVGSAPRLGGIIECPVPNRLLDAGSIVELTCPEASRALLGQVGPPRLASHIDEELNVLTVVIPANLELPADSQWTWKLTPSHHQSPECFAWKKHSDYEDDLIRGQVPVLRYVFEPLDPSTPQRRDDTFKPYHHLFAPGGSLLVTKGTGGLFPHHRGLSYAFNRISYGDQQADVWHCRDGESQSHVEEVSTDGGPVYGRHQVVIDWHGRSGDVFARETRELTAYAVDSGQLIEFRSRLTTTLPQVRLDGDPQHAGFQFRAAQHVADVSKAETYYVRPEGRDQPGVFRNWSAAEDETELNRRHVDLPWNAVSFVIEGRRFTCAYLAHPSNPKPARFSERDYGRFGSYFEYDLTPEHPLEIRYRVWLQDGEMDVEAVHELSRDFCEPIKASLSAQ